jgi:hypothetical protein
MLHLFFHINQPSILSSQERCLAVSDSKGYDVPGSIILGRFDGQNIKHIQ